MDGNEMSGGGRGDVGSCLTSPAWEWDAHTEGSSSRGRLYIPKRIDFQKSFKQPLPPPPLPPPRFPPYFLKKKKSWAFLRTHWCFGIVLWSNIAASVQRKICNICFNKEMIPPPTLFETFPKKNPFWNPQPSLGPSCNVLHALAHPNVRSPGWGQLLQDAILGVNHSCADTYR